MNWLPSWLVAAASPLIFLGSCTASLLPVWEWQDRKMTHPVKESEQHIVPLLAVKNGKYVVTGQRAAEGATVVTSISRADEGKVNRDLCDQLGWKDHYYPWFQVLEEKDGLTRVSLEAPTGKDSKRKGWYSLRSGTITFDRIVYYGPGFAYIVMPWTLACGILGVVIFRVSIWLLKRPNKAVQPTTTSVTPRADERRIE